MGMMNSLSTNSFNLPNQNGNIQRPGVRHHHRAHNNTQANNDVNNIGQNYKNNNTSNTSNNTNSQQQLSIMLPQLMQALMQLLAGLTSQAGTSTNTNSTPATDTGTTSTAPNSSCSPPVTPPVTPPIVPPTTDSTKVLGSAGLFGDPKMGLFTPNLGNAPAALQSFESNLKAGQTATLLDDSDQGGFKVTGNAIQVDPNNPSATGIGSASFTSGADTVNINGNGQLMINNVNVAKLSDTTDMAPIQLANGMTVSTSQQVDGANGHTAKRFVISNGEYKVTAGARQPNGATPYLDMNFEELTKNAADNATGYQTSVPGLNNPVGIADLLRIEPGTLNSIA